MSIFKWILTLSTFLVCASANSTDLLSNARPALSGAQNGYGTPATAVSGVRTKCAISDCLTVPGNSLGSYQITQCNEMAAASGITLSSGEDIFEYISMCYGGYCFGTIVTGIKPGAFIAGFGVRADYPPYYANVSAPTIACR